MMIFLLRSRPGTCPQEVSLGVEVTITVPAMKETESPRERGLQEAEAPVRLV
jgi:hypothetical protein